MTRNRIFIMTGGVIVCLFLAAAAPVEAQSEFGPLFDKFNFKLAGSWVKMSTEIRLDSERLGTGTTLSFEDDLDLKGNQTIPTLAFEWQIARKHRLGVRWQDISRDSTAQALTEIQWGDEVIPVDANITLAFDISQLFIDYTYYPWINERWAFGFGCGLRVMELSSTLAYSEEENNIEGSTDIKGTGPLPYLYFEYRLMFSDNWRFVTGLGWIQVKISDIEGGQWIGRAGIEYLFGDHWSFGGALNIARINVDWEGVEVEDRESLLTAAVDLNIGDITVFARVRF
jgi:hypothetical protein